MKLEKVWLVTERIVEKTVYAILKGRNIRPNEIPKLYTQMGIGRQTGAGSYEPVVLYYINSGNLWHSYGLLGE